jgi:Arc/MetJ-type ribon-helix-helix transcriptional regulator
MAETEKITINMSVVDLGKVDLLVDEGFYQNRTDFLRAAIRGQLDRHDVELKNAVVRNNFVLGVLVYDNQELERMIAKGEQRAINVVGMLILDRSVTPELADKAIASVHVRGVFRASDAVKAILAGRIS